MSHTCRCVPVRVAGALWVTDHGFRQGHGLLIAYAQRPRPGDETLTVDAEHVVRLAWLVRMVAVSGLFPPAIGDVSVEPDGRNMRIVSRGQRLLIQAADVDALDGVLARLVGVYS